MDVPIYITLSVLAGGAFAVIAVPNVIRRARKGEAAAERIYLIVGLVLATWFATVTALAWVGAFRAAPTGVVPAPGIALAAALGGLALAVAAVPALRAVLGDPATQPRLLALHVWRVEGLAFLVLMALGQLPALFAVPAGIGDLAIGLTAPLMARNLHRRGWAIAWNMFGLADLAIAVSLGVMTSPGLLQAIHTDPTLVAITTFPMVIIPTFLVPLSVGLHFVSLRYLLSARGLTAGPPGPIPA